MTSRLAKLFLITALFSLNASAIPQFSLIAKCSNVEFLKPNSPDLKKCPECKIDDRGVLTCTCLVENENGAVKTSSLPIYACPKNYAFPRCADHIEVKNGELSCRKISEESTYHNHCWSCKSDGSLLTCDCYQEGRNHIETTLDMKDCFEPISNCHGVLTCGLCPRKVVEEESWTRPIVVFLLSAGGVTVVARFVWIRYLRR